MVYSHVRVRPGEQIVLSVRTVYVLLSRLPQVDFIKARPLQLLRDFFPDKADEVNKITDLLADGDRWH